MQADLRLVDNGDHYCRFADGNAASDEFVMLLSAFELHGEHRIPVFLKIRSPEHKQRYEQVLAEHF